MKTLQERLDDAELKLKTEQIKSERIRQGLLIVDVMRELREALDTVTIDEEKTSLPAEPILIHVFTKTQRILIQKKYINLLTKLEL